MLDDSDYQLLCKLAYQSWLDRGQPTGSPEIDWDFAISQLGLHAPVAITHSRLEQLDVTDDA